MLRSPAVLLFPFLVSVAACGGPVDAESSELEAQAKAAQPTRRACAARAEGPRAMRTFVLAILLLITSTASAAATRVILVGDDADPRVEEVRRELAAVGLEVLVVDRRSETKGASAVVIVDGAQAEVVLDANEPVVIDGRAGALGVRVAEAVRAGLAAATPQPVEDADDEPSATAPPPAPLGEVQFAADRAVLWSVDEPNGGRIGVDGLYLPPTKAGTYHVTARDPDDDRAVARAMITVRPLTLEILAGQPGGPGDADGTGADVRFLGLGGLWAAADRVLLADHRLLRAFDRRTGAVSTIASLGTNDSYAPGCPSARGVVVRGDDAYVSCPSSIYRVRLSTGEASRIAGGARLLFAEEQSRRSG